MCDDSTFGIDSRWALESVAQGNRALGSLVVLLMVLALLGPARMAWG